MEFQLVAFAFVILLFIIQPKHQLVFLCRRGLNFRFLIQPLKFLSIKLTKTHKVDKTC